MKRSQPVHCIILKHLIHGVLFEEAMEAEPVDNRSITLSTDVEGGRGFGLYSCTSYMQEMDGEVSVGSDGEGKGTTFIVKSPRNKYFIRKMLGIVWL